MVGSLAERLFERRGFCGNAIVDDHLELLFWTAGHFISPASGGHKQVASSIYFLEDPYTHDLFL